MYRTPFRSMAGSILGAAMLLGSGVVSAMPIVTATEAPNSPLAGPGTYTTEYIISNPVDSTDIVTLVEIEFEAGLYENIRFVGHPAYNFDQTYVLLPGDLTTEPYIEDSGFEIPGYAFLDTYLNPGESESGFLLQYSYLGMDTMPLSGQSFTVYNDAFDELSSGTFGSAEVPEPTGLALFAIGAFGLAATRRRLNSSKEA